MSNGVVDLEYLGVLGRVLHLPVGTEVVRDIEGSWWRVDRRSYIGWRGMDRYEIVEELIGSILPKGYERVDKKIFSGTSDIGRDFCIYRKTDGEYVYQQTDGWLEGATDEDREALKEYVSSYE